jgi:hypothetical protein
VILSFSVLVYDLRKNNKQISSLMKMVWILTVFYSGPLSLSVYWYSGRKQIKKDNLWRRGWRSDAHCFSGCGGGEIVGVLIATGLLTFGNFGIAVITFFLAYIFGYALTVGPLVQEGVHLTKALKDALYSETASITVMEVVAIAVDLFLSVGSKISHPLFWLALTASLSAGYLAAYPVNVLLVKRGIKEGMSDPTNQSA